MTATLEKASSGLWLPEGVAPKPERRVVSAYRWNKMTKGEQEAAREMGWQPPMGGGAARTYGVWNGAMPTTAALVKVTTGTAIKTMLQVQPSSNVGIRIIEWGVAFDATAATPVECELIDTSTVNATVTAYVANDVMKMNGPNDEAANIVLGTAASGYTSTAEGVITATRLGDYQLVSQAYVKQFPLGREFEVPVSHNLRVRVTAAVAAGAICYVIFEE